MSSYQVKTPVALIVFNRPDHAIANLAAIKQAKPSKLLIIADGPRSERPGEKELCQKTQEIVNLVDWPCELLTNFSETNLGCKNRVASGINWIFQHTDEAIILEDDCIPHISFFRYCDEMLEKYRDDPRIMTIAGSNLLGCIHKNYSYTFSKFGPVWGWATWKRAWNLYDIKMNKLDEVLKEGWERSICANSKEIQYYIDSWKSVKSGRVDTWDWQWDFCRYINRGLGIIPAKNMITNVGFDEMATHTNFDDNKLANKQTQELEFPLKHPNVLVRDREFDEIYFSKICQYSFSRRVVNKFKKLFIH